MDEPKYSTYVFDAGDFSIDLKDIDITTAVDTEKLEYHIKAKLDLDTPISRVLELLQSGMSFTVTLADGKKYQLKLESIEKQNAHRS
jgi:ubiquinone biosynthesis protein COQ9